MTETTPASIDPSSAKSRGFWALIITQFQGAFSDNALKSLVIFLVVGLNLPPEKRDTLIPLIGALFALPFILFSMTGGFFADRFSKRSVTIGIKYFEIGIMFLALISLVAHQIYLSIACVFLMGVHSALFGPSKYGLLPELLSEKKLSWGNGVLELGTFLAIIGGTVAGGWLSETFQARPAWSGVIFIMLALAGLATSFGITKIPAANPQKKFRANFLGDLWTQLKIISRNRDLSLAVAGNAYFFAVAALVQLLVVTYSSDVLHLAPRFTGYLQAATALGIGLGSFAAGYFSGGRIEPGLIPIGAVGLTLFSVLLGASQLAFKTVAAELAALGFFGGLFIVPISALLQHLPARSERGGVLAAANLVSFIGIFLSAGVYYLCASVFKLAPPEIFLVIAGLCLIATIVVFKLLPGAVLRFTLRALARGFYRFKIVGRENIPAQGGALLVCNHVSFADAVMVGVGAGRPIRFLLFKGIYERWWVRPFADALGAIPVSSQQHPRELIKSLEAAREALRAGELVCIFAEGEITRIGLLLPFRRGLERIVKDTGTSIIPVALSGVIGSPSSFKSGRFILWPKQIPQPVSVSFGKQLPPETPPYMVREAVQALLADAAEYFREQAEMLPRSFVRTCRKNARRFSMADPQNSHVTFSQVLTRTIFLARRLKKIWRGQAMVGIFLPPGVPGALVNHAAFLCGKVPVNLNYTLTAETLASCVRQCDIKTVITSRKFLEKIKLTPPGELICLEDIAANPRATEKIAAWLLAKFAPINLLARILQNRQSKIENRQSLDSLATIIFSSGSTGEPKGVMLSHFNLATNIAQMEQILCFDRDQRILGVLPFFHSFGFSVTLCLPAIIGTGVVFYPNPLEAKAIGALVREHNVTVLLSTATFLQLYIRVIPPADFGSLKFVVTGAEKLPERIATAFEEHFGIRPLEGYGSTECSPAVAVNVPDFRAAGFCQIGNQRGKIGMPVPGMVAKIADAENPWSDKIIPRGEPGMLLVRGPNVMRGYLGQPEKTAEVLRDGWYCTGDIAALGEDGFLQITGRLSRFSKIGGEMIPHLKIEEKLHELAGVSDQTFFVTGLPDEKKGERLVVLHKLPEDALPPLLEKFSNSELPNLWKPRGDSFYRVENFPLLGTGKLDLRGVKEMAAKLAG